MLIDLLIAVAILAIAWTYTPALVALLITVIVVLAFTGRLHGRR